MGDDVDDNTLPGSAVDNAAQAPTGQKRAATYKHWSLESKLYALDVLKRLTVAGAMLSTTYETRSLQHTSIFWFLICSIGSDWNQKTN
jgi:hypothetical protein